MLNVTLTGVTSITNGLTTTLQNAPAGKINLDLSQTQITSIGNSAFDGCESLKSVNIPSSVTSIGDSAFMGCTSLTAINVDSANAKYSSDDGILYNKDKTILVACPGKKTSVNIPSGVTSIGDDAFSMCESLTSVNIPSSVTSIGDHAFDGCMSLKSVNIPSGVTSIGEYAFFGCDFTSVNIPSGVTSIGEYAFSSCYSLTSVTIPSRVTSIGEGAFDRCTSLASVTIPSSVMSIGDWAFNSCISLASVYVKAATTPSGGNNMFKNCHSSLKIYVPTSSVAGYKVASGWKDYDSKIEAE